MVRFTIRKDPDAPGYYFVNGGNIAGKYVKQIRVAGKIHAQLIADARNRVVKKRANFKRIYWGK